MAIAIIDDTGFSKVLVTIPADAQHTQNVCIGILLQRVSQKINNYPVKSTCRDKVIPQSA